MFALNTQMSPCVLKTFKVTVLQTHQPQQLGFFIQTQTAFVTIVTTVAINVTRVSMVYATFSNIPAMSLPGISMMSEML